MMAACGVLSREGPMAPLLNDGRAYEVWQGRHARAVARTYTPLDPHATIGP
jgi:hypothetical protein